MMMMMMMMMRDFVCVIEANVLNEYITNVGD